MDFIAYFIFFIHDTTHLNRAIQIKFVYVPSTDVISEEEPSHTIHPDSLPNANVE